jgi:DNA-binding NtrC family response regulator
MQNKINVLIVDDQLAARESVRMVLKDKYSIAMFAGATEAFKFMDENPVDLVLLDLKMEKMDGITALKEIKKKYPQTKVILLTAYASLETQQKAIELGAFGCIMKPFDKDELLNMVDRALQGPESIKNSS